METIIINQFIEREYNVFERYKNHIIVADIQYPDCIQVYNPVRNTLFIVALDDSKLCGYRKFDESMNNIKEAKKYIDWAELPSKKAINN